jgi:simple sugar transport system substrate-binding protein
MMKLRPFLVFLGAVVLNNVLAADMRIVVVSHGHASRPFWKVVKNGVDQAGKDMKVDVAYRAPETHDMLAMAQLIDAAVAQSPDGLVVSIPDAESLGDSIRKAVAAGIPVVSMNTGSAVAKSLGITVHVGQEDYAAGLGAGALMQALGGKNALCINHEVGNVAVKQRCEGFARGFSGSSRVLSTGRDPQTVISKVKAALSADESIDTVMALAASTVAEPALEALKQIGMVGEVKLGTFDLSANILEAIDKRQVTFAIDQQQFMQGYLPVVILALHNRYGLMPGGNIPTGPGFVTPANVFRVIGLSAQGIR